MKIADNLCQIKGNYGDHVKIDIKSAGTQHLVNYDLHGEAAVLDEGQPLTIKLEKPIQVRFDLNFSQTKGGTYYIEVKGPKGKSSNFHFEQMPGEKAKIICLGLEGDPTIEPV